MSQAHLSHDVGMGSDPAIDEYYRQQSHAASVPKTREEQGYPNVYVNGEDLTVTVNPVNKAHTWIRDDSYAFRHPAHMERKAQIDHVAHVTTAALLDRHPGPPETFVPTTQMIDARPKLTGRCVMNSTRGYVKRTAATSLPIHSKLIYENRLRDKPSWMVERDLYMENTHLSRNRAFDCDGYCR